MTPTKQQLDIQATLKQAVTREIAVPALTTAEHGKFAGRTRDTESFRLRADRIRPDADQVRRMDKSVEDPEVQELAKSIAEYGLINYPEVRYIESDDIYELIAGERRFTAMTKILAWTEIPVRVIDVPEERILWLQLHENIHRKDLHPLDLAKAVHKAMAEENLTIEEVAGRLHRSQTFVQKALTIAKQLTAEAAQIIQQSPKSTGLDTVYQVATSPPENQVELAKNIATNGLTHRQVITLAAHAKKQRPTGANVRSGRPTASKPYTKVLKSSNGATVAIKFRKSRVAPDEVIAALTDVLQALRAEQKKAA